MNGILASVIRLAVTCALIAWAYVYALKYNLHMFQLNGYKNAEHITWLRRFKKRQWVLYAGLVLGALWIIFRKPVTADIVMWLWIVLIAVVFRALCNMSVKKKLVWTARVKRLAASIIVLDLLVIAAVFILTAAFFGILTALQVVRGACLMLLSVKFISPLIGCIVNSPMEKGVNRHFINDAKRKLSANPGMTIIGVTGSYGKTSVKYYLGELLSVKYTVTITPESYNTPMGVVRTVREHMKPGTEVFVCEMGARHVGDIKELCDLVHPHHGIITSVGPQHLDTFHTMDNIVSTKFELADAVPEGGMLFLNGDNEFEAKKAASYSDKNPVMYYAKTEDAAVTSKGYRAEDIHCDSQGTSFDIVTPDGERDSFRMSLIGEHNIINVVGAIAVAHSMGIALSDLKIPVRRLKSVKHRLELIRRGDMYIIDDAYNSNPVGSKAALDTLDMFDGTKIMITPGMVELGEKEEEYNREFGRHAGEVCDHLLLVGRKRAVPIREGALEAGMDVSRIKEFDKVEDAFGYAQQIRAEGTKYILLENDLPDNY
ncbi:MAG: UDP-N-acetylmuramoyl-tripeptide--D-alanyl-D-alanine ligase [Lachnospiraceae bacterium]|nr:UDP-N-acetylmuramoyl-tripeptide--D-alanyl-D-alanine ligase [Lachnospiraceae bacterium]